MSVADQLFKAIEAGDVEGVRDVYAPDARIWHNFDQLDQTVEENLRVLGWLCATFTERSYDEVRRHEWDGGFVQQHVLRLTRQDGTKVEIPCCIVAELAGGRITRIDEYLDSAHAARLTG